MEIHGRSGKNSLRVVKSSKLVKGLRKGLPIYILRLNQPSNVEEGKKIKGNDPEWLKEY